MKVLVAEDNALLGNSIKRALQEIDCTVDLAIDGAEALYFADNSEYHVMVIDWMLPKLSGIELVKKLRAKTLHTPIIMITARDTVPDRVEGLTQGADDYLIKPFDMAELLARVQALYRRSNNQGTNTRVVGLLTLNLATHCISVEGKNLDLTAKEYDLLVSLMAKPGEIVTRNKLSSLLYQMDTEPDSNSLDVLLNRVRKKLADSHVTIETVRSKGFILHVAPTLP